MTDEELTAVDSGFVEEAPTSPLAARAARARMHDDPEARARYEALVRLERGLEDGAPVTRGQVARMKALGPPLPKIEGEVAPAAEPPNPMTPARRVRSAWWAAALAPAAAIAAALLFAPTSTGDFAARGGAPSGAKAWVRVFAARGEAVAPLGARLPAKAGLVFAYHNLSESPYRYLAIAGRDSAGRVHWYHPAYRTAQDRPKSIPIEAGAADVELRERVFAEHSPGPLEICGLFTVEPLDVHRVDRALEGGAPWPEAALSSCHRVEVVP